MTTFKHRSSKLISRIEIYNTFLSSLPYESMMLRGKMNSEQAQSTRTRCIQ